MGIEFDLNRALFLTYVGVGAAFLVLGSMVVFTALVGGWGNWRLRRAQARAEEAAAGDLEPSVAVADDSGENGVEPELAAAIATAVAMATEAYRREQEDELAPTPRDSGTDISGWREQGRILAFEGRRIRERDR